MSFSLKKTVSVFVSFVLVIVSVLFFDITVFAEDDTEEPEYALDSVLVLMDHEHSAIGTKYENMNYFQSDLIESVKDIMYLPDDCEDLSLFNVEEFQQVVKVKLKEPSVENLDRLIAELSQYDGVESVDKNYIYKIEEPEINENPVDNTIAVTLPSSRSSFARVPMNADYYVQPEMTTICAIHAWQITTGLHSILVGVADTGIYFDHPDLVGKGGTGLDKNFTTESTDNDLDGHGTHVAGIIAATSNQTTGFSGVAPGVKLVNLKVATHVEGKPAFNAHCESDWFYNAVQYASQKNIRIINASISINAPSLAQRKYIKNYKGLIVASAGNGGQNTCYYPAKLDYDNIISVAASTSDDYLSEFSNYHKKYVDLYAPGVRIKSSVPYFADTSGYKSLDGTSMSAAFVSGAVALLWSTKYSSSAAEVKKLLLDNVDKVDRMSGKVSTGGRLNVFKPIMAGYGWIQGDVDMDGKLTAADARYVQRWASRLEAFTDFQFAIGDMNLDLDLTAEDARTILRKAANLENTRDISI